MNYVRVAHFLNGSQRNKESLPYHIYDIPDCYGSHLASFREDDSFRIGSIFLNDVAAFKQNFFAISSNDKIILSVEEKPKNEFPYIEPVCLLYENMADIPAFFYGEDFMKEEKRIEKPRITISTTESDEEMSKSVSIPIALSELKRSSFRRLSSKKEKKKETSVEGFVVLVQETGNTVKLYGSTSGLEIGDEILAVNDMQVEGKTHSDVVKYMQQCIRNKLLQLSVRRKPRIPAAQEGTSVITDAYLVSVERDRTKELTLKLKKEYPDIRVFDMETIAAGKKTTFDIPDKNEATKSAEEVERLRKYDADLKERISHKMERQKENDFLRSSLRSSMKLKALSYSKETPSNILKESRETPVKSYENQCYDKKDKEDNNNSAIPLNQVIGSVDRLSDHLSQMGSEEECRVLREYFQSRPVVDAIEATATRRGDKNTRVSNGVSCANSVPSEEPLVKLITLHKEEDSYLGATVRCEENRIVVGRVVKGGVVEKTGLFQQGDELLEVNGVPLRGKTINEVCELMRTISGDIRFAVSAATHEEKERPPTQIRHLRALFDYDPEDDIYIPCKELSLKFERGDILHVLNTSDENWWQAYRDGDDSAHQLAGLIPSTSFHEQVVMYTEEIIQDNRPKTRKHRKSIPEVIRTFGRKAGCEIQRSLDEPTAVEPSQAEVLTYEEVVLHLTRSDRRRPLVLCGPEGVGCLQLRQKLLESDPQRLASPVPYTTRSPKDGEVDGVHYHFITQQQFIDDSKAGCFVEFGEYQKHLYGTALADIVNVVKNGKTCVMSLKAESLQSVRTREVMPYIVFIAPPSLIQLRRQRECEGQFEVKDQTLKNVLIQGKHIEQKYGHLFDDIIVNTEFERSLLELKKILKKLDTEPHWVPSRWITVQ